MSYMATCEWCGRKFEAGIGKGYGNAWTGKTICSKKCLEEKKKAEGR